MRHEKNLTQMTFVRLLHLNTVATLSCRSHAVTEIAAGELRQRPPFAFVLDDDILSTCCNNDDVIVM